MQSLGIRSQGSTRPHKASSTVLIGNASLRHRHQHRQRLPVAVPAIEIASLDAILFSMQSLPISVQAFVDTTASAAPGPLQPAIQAIGGDVAALLALAPTLPGVARLLVSITPGRQRGSTTLSMNHMQ